MTALPIDLLTDLRELIGNEYMDETARRRLTAWLARASLLVAPATQEAVDASRVQDAIDMDNGFRRYPWTYQNQPGNVGAWALGRACNAAALESAGDPIDRGLGLLKHLHTEGLGIVRVAPLAGKA